jgi:hypothetical protein
MSNELDYESLWYEEIAQQWINDFVFDELSYEEIGVEITDPNGDVDPDDPNDENFKVKNIIFTIKHDGKRQQLWVFYDIENEEFHDCESLGNSEFDPEELGKTIYEINRRWEAEKIIRDLKDE